MKERKAVQLTRRIYSKSVESEWNRAVKDPFHCLEFDTTMRFLKKHLPKKGLVLDAGGGPGRYTIELAKMGYEVILLDITPENLDFATEKIIEAGVADNVKGIVEGSITDLSIFKNNSFDAVLCLGGPLSHVSESGNRSKAISELIRIAKPGAPIAVSVIGRFGVLACAPGGWPEEISTRNFLNEAFKGEDHMWRGNHYAHLFVLDEFERLFKGKAKVIERVGLEGLATPIAKEINELHKHKSRWRNWIKAHYGLCTHPSVIDFSQHIMLIARK